jgi:hypothetical protein
VFVQVRQLTAPGEGGVQPALASQSDIRSWLVAVDLTTGRPLWSTFLAKGVEVTPDTGRRLLARGSPLGGAQPPAAVGGRIFAGTHVGAGVLVDAADGRVVWSLKNRRRAGDQTTWTGSRPPTIDEPPRILWAPADGDHLYWLRGEGDVTGRGLFVHPPRAVGEAVALVGGDLEQALVLSRAGRELGLSAWGAASGSRTDSPHLGPGEVFTGEGLASPRRVLVASNHGLYLADRERDLFLLDFAPLRQVGAPGGSLYARGDRVWVVGRHVIWLFGAR